jgi:DNA polymerase-3 subunit epsilon
MPKTLGRPTDRTGKRRLADGVSVGRHTVCLMPSLQASFDELGRPLSDLTFCVVDLETTGGSAAKGSKITEFGAVKVRGGEVLGEFQSLVNPDEHIPAFITVLTGITDMMVIDAPRIAEVLPSFLEFAKGCVLVAHNAPFDVGFLKFASRELGYDWPRFEILDTAILARRTLNRDEVPNCKLSTLAAKFHATTTPNHRALDDARATVDVLHALFERLGPHGVSTLEEVSTYTSRVSPAQRKKRWLAEHLPNAPGVYLFRGPKDDVLYIGTSRNIRARARSYFTKSETRSRMAEMVQIAQRIEGIACASALEAQVRELRLIGRHKPPYNRRSRNQDKVSWLKLTREAWPRLSVVRAILDDDADYIGPFRGRGAAEGAITALHDTFRIRQCTQRLAQNSQKSPCVLAEMGHCLSPCDGSADPETYFAEVSGLREAMLGNPAALIDNVTDKMNALAANERYEDAAIWRDRLTAFLRAAARTQRLRELTGTDELVAAAPRPDGWEIHVFRFGRLAAAGVMPHGALTEVWVDSLVSAAESVEGGFGPAPAATAEETECLLRWLDQDGIRMVRGSWQCASDGSARHLPNFEGVSL